MKKQKPIIENGIIAGNLYNKYETCNPIAKYLMKSFYNSLNVLIYKTHAIKIHEVGCGEGNISILLAKQEMNVRASDFSHQVIAEAKENARNNNVDITFQTMSIYDLDPKRDSADLVICCEVLEHLEKPQEAIDILSQLASPYLIVSVPREPLWRGLNLLRGKYISSLGNTPGHIQHWSTSQFINLLSSKLNVIALLTPVPWSMALCRSRRCGIGSNGCL